jgi:hypothetical protein
MPENAALYVDGFNLFHAIDGLKKNYLKWLDLWSLGELIIPSRSQRLRRVVYCTAIRNDDQQKMLRHREYIKALETRGVECLRGHFSTENASCRKCGTSWEKQVEKQGDVNLALSLLDDAYRNVFDHAYLLTSDGDQCATVRLLKQRFPDKKLTTVAPPGRAHNKMIFEIADAKITITENHLERSMFLGPVVMTPDQRSVAARRPKEYNPPPGWVDPACRPAKGLMVASGRSNVL